MSVGGCLWQLMLTSSALPCGLVHWSGSKDASDFCPPNCSINLLVYLQVQCSGWCEFPRLCFLPVFPQQSPVPHILIVLSLSDLQFLSPCEWVSKLVFPSQDFSGVACWSGALLAQLGPKCMHRFSDLVHCHAAAVCWSVNCPIHPSGCRYMHVSPSPQQHFCSGSFPPTFLRPKHGHGFQGLFCQHGTLPVWQKPCPL